MTLKWDLFVPFVAQSATVLKDGGVMCLITSSAIEKAPYADALRRQLLAATQPREIHFFPNVRLFADAVVENTIVLAEKGVAPPTHGVARYWHTQVPTTGSRVERQTLPLSYGDDVFRQILPALKLKKGVKHVRLVDLCYLSVGSDTRSRSRAALELLAKTTDPWYLLGFLNSPQMWKLLAGVSRSAIAERLQPNDLREILVPLPPQAVADDIARLAQEATDCQRALLSYRRRGWTINGKGIEPTFAVPAGIATRELGRAKVRWGIYIVTPGAKLVRLERQERRIMAGRAVAIDADATVSEEALEWLTGQLRQSGQYDLQVAEKTGLPIPATPQDAEQAWRILQGEKANIVALLERIAAIKADIAARLDELFERIQHPVRKGIIL